MHLPLVDPHLVLDVRLPAEDLLDLAPGGGIHQAVPVAQRHAERLPDGLQVGRQAQQGRVVGDGGVDQVAARGEDGVAASPAEAEHADPVGAGDQADRVEEAVDDGPADGLAVGDEPGPQRGGDGGRVLGLVQRCELRLGLERRLDGLQERGRQRGAREHVRHVDGEVAGAGVRVGAEARVREGPAEDFRRGGAG